MARRVSSCLGAVGGAGLREDVAYMPNDGVEADYEPIRNLLVALAGCDEPEHLDLALREAPG